MNEIGKPDTLHSMKRNSDLSLKLIKLKKKRISLKQRDVDTAKLRISIPHKIHLESTLLAHIYKLYINIFF